MTDPESLHPATARPSGRLKGVARVPGDRTIAHRALILGGLAAGETRISGVPESDDVLRTVAAMRALGARVENLDGTLTLSGVGNGCLLEAADPLDFGESAEGAQLVMGLCGVYDMRTRFVADPAVTRLPIGRVLDPLRLMGVQVYAAPGDRLPLTLRGPKVAAPISYRIPLASSHIKSCVLLAGLNAPGVTTVIESLPTPDHMERLLRFFGAGLKLETDAGGLRQVRIGGQGRLTGQTISLPGDPACAAGLVVAALIVPESDLTIENQSVNPTRAGLLVTLREMGASIELLNRRTTSGEDVADIRVRYSRLTGVTVPAHRAHSMMDEYPALAVAAAFADGETRMEGLNELRADGRYGAICAGLAANGVEFDEGRDDLVVRGSAGVTGGATVETGGDPSIALAFLVMGLAARQPVQVDDMTPLAAIFPGFAGLARQLGAEIE